MRRFSNPLAIPLAFFSRDLYRDVAREWLGSGLVYLLLVTLVCAVPPLIAMQAGLARFARVEAGPILEQIPPIVIRDGRLSTVGPMPLVIRDAKGTALAVIDTTGQVSSLESTEAHMLVTSTQLMYRKSAVESRTFAFSRIGSFEMDRARMTRWLRGFVTWFTPVLFPFAFAGMFLFRLMQVVVFAAIGALIARPLGVRFSFAPLMRLAAVAFTPVFLLDALRGAAHLHVPQWRLLSMVIALVYLIYALQANREPAAVPADVSPPPTEAHPGG